MTHCGTDLAALLVAVVITPHNHGSTKSYMEQLQVTLKLEYAQRQSLLIDPL